jgi:hypothetical protein
VPESLSNISTLTRAELIVVGRKDFGSVNIPLMMELSPAERLRQASRSMSPDAFAANEILRSQHELHFIDFQLAVCGNRYQCPLFTPAGDLISYDGSHLTPAGAKWAGTQLMLHSAEYRRIFSK